MIFIKFVNDQVKVILYMLRIGAYGYVNKVIHKTTGMIRAMKVIKKTSLIKEDEQNMFGEMNILKNLDHPNIIKLYELF